MFGSDINNMYVTMSLEVYLWVMRGETRERRLKRANMVLNKRKREGRKF